MSSDAPRSTELTRRLIAREMEGSGPSGDSALAAHLAFERAYRDMARRFGPAGSRTLLARALAEAGSDHPVLDELGIQQDTRIGRPLEPGLTGVSAAMQNHGADTVAAAIEQVLAIMLDMLGRLIGDDMVAMLMDQSEPIATQADGNML